MDSSSMASRAATMHVNTDLTTDLTTDVTTDLTTDVSPWLKRDEGPPTSGVSPISTEALPKSCNRLQ
jgi:hypothetical protein